MKVINLFGGPGAGKSTTRAGLFNLMKLGGLNVEEVYEYAKDMVWEQRHNVFQDQLYILAKQHRRVLRLQGSIGFAVTDSPILLGCFYQDKTLPYAAELENLTIGVFNSFDNVNVFINRNHDYQEIGRNQNAEEAHQIALDIKNYLVTKEIPFIEVDSHPELPKELLETLLPIICAKKIDNEVYKLKLL